MPIKTILSVCLACALALSASAAAQTCATTTLYSNDFESGFGMDGWTAEFLFGNQSQTNDWRGIQACDARSESYVFRFGGEAETCDGDYTDSQVSAAGSPLIQVPLGSTTTRLSVWHRREFEDGKDGGRMAVKVGDSSIFTLVQDVHILSGATHSGTLDGGCGSTVTYSGMPVFTGTALGFEETVVDLDAVCDAATQGSGGCAGHSIQIGFLSFTDCSFAADGWFLDDVQVTACEPPSPSDYFTVAPCRLVDTRNLPEPLQPHGVQSFVLTGSCDIPSTARALAVNVTAVEAGAAGHIRIWPSDVEGTETSVLNFTAGQNRANNAIVTLPLDGSGSVSVLAATDETVHLVIDVAGYFE